jgi:YHS domain-containing protein
VLTRQTRTDLPIDPVCRMAIEPGRAAARREHRGVEYLFCSDRCAMAFDDDPAEYVSRTESLG